jgi:hypothetical protein
MLKTNVSSLSVFNLLVKPIGCGNYMMTVFYFFSFFVIVVLVFMRLFIAITITAFQETNERDNKFMNSHLSDHFREIWSGFDPDVSPLSPYI